MPAPATTRDETALSVLLSRSIRGLVATVLDSKAYGCKLKTHAGHGSFLKVRQLRLPQFASVYSDVNGYRRCWEGTCEGLASCPVK